MRTQTKTATFEEVKKCIAKWYEKHAGIELEPDAHFMTIEQWKERGEQYGGDDAVLVMTFDGSGVYDYVNMHAGYKAHDDLIEELGKLGCWFELMYAWSFAVYPH